MPARSSSGRATRSILILVFIGAIVLGSMAAYVKLLPRLHPTQVVSSPSPEPADTGGVTFPMERPTRTPETPSQKPGLQIPEIHGQDVVLGSDEAHPETGEEPAVFLANESLKAVHAEGAKALSVHMKEHIAYVDFSPEIEDGFGSMQEGNFIKAMQVSLGQLPEVNQFQITVGGQPIESLGHFEVTDPIDVIRPTIKP